MFKLYRKSQDAQYNWILNHPTKFIVLNVTLIVVAVGYLEYKDRREMRELKNEIA
jgi:heterodisulfide reductase subunit A-like polyferredoxin